MAYVDKRLLKAAKEAGNKIAIEVGESVVGLYTGYEVKKNDRYDKLQYCFAFRFTDGTVKELRTASAKVLKKFATIQPNTKLEITKLGEGTSTDYEIKIVGVARQAAPVETDEDLEQVDVEEEVTDDGEEEVDPLDATF